MLIVAAPAFDESLKLTELLFVSRASAEPAVEKLLKFAIECESRLSCASAFVAVPKKLISPPFVAANIALPADVEGEPEAELPKTRCAVFAIRVGALEELS